MRVHVELFHSTDFLQIRHPHWLQFLLICFSVLLFSFFHFKAYYFEVLFVLTLSHLPWLTCMFLFHNLSCFVLYLLQILDRPDWEQTTQDWMLNYRHSLTTSSSAGGMLPANQPGATAHWGLQRLFLFFTCRLIYIFRLWCICFKNANYKIILFFTLCYTHTSHETCGML